MAGTYGFRGMIALWGVPLVRKRFGQFARISAAGVNSMDMLLPSVPRYSGKDMIPITILYAVLIGLGVPPVFAVCEVGKR